LSQQLRKFEKAAAKGHEQSLWVLRAAAGIREEKQCLKEAFGKTNEPLGWYLAGKLSDVQSREAFDFYQKSAEGGCAWAQVEYAWYFGGGSDFVEKDESKYLALLEQEVNQSNPKAMSWLADYWTFQSNLSVDHEVAAKVLALHEGAVALGWKDSMSRLSMALHDAEICEADWRRAIRLSARACVFGFWALLEDVMEMFESGEDEDGDFNPLCYSLGWGLYWYPCSSGFSNCCSEEQTTFGEGCLDYYCSCVELQQKSIVTFLLFWNRTVGIRGPGQIIGKMVWYGREDNLLKGFEVRSESIIKK
jgi:TPR repeat protein